MDQKLVTNAWIDWFHTFITHVNTNNLVMWVTLQNNADWDCFKILILRENCGIWLFLFWETWLRLQRDRDVPLSLTEVKDLKGKPTRWIILIVFPQTSRHQEALLHVIEDNEAEIKMIFEERNATMRHVSRTHRVALDWLFDRINLNPKIQIKYIDTNNELADILTKGNFTRDEWNHLLCLFWRKDLTHDSGEERVTVKSRPMMNLIVRTSSHVSSSTSAGPVKRSYASQDPWSSIVKKEQRSGWPDNDMDHCKLLITIIKSNFWKKFSSASYSKRDDDRAWSSQGRKTDIETHERSGRPDETSWKMTREVRPDFSHEETLHDRTAQSVMNEGTLRDRSERPDIDSQEERWPQQFVSGNDEAELELSVESRSFLNRVNDQVRKRQKRISNVTQNDKNILWFGECLWL